MRPTVAPAVAVDFDASHVRGNFWPKKQLDVSDEFRYDGRDNRKKSVRGPFAWKAERRAMSLAPKVASATFTFDDGFRPRSRATSSFMAVNGTRDRWSICSTGFGSSAGPAWFSTGKTCSASRRPTTRRTGKGPGQLGSDARSGCLPRYVVGGHGSTDSPATDRAAVPSRRVLTDVLEEGDGCAVICGSAPFEVAVRPVGSDEERLRPAGPERAISAPESGAPGWCCRTTTSIRT